MFCLICVRKDKECEINEKLFLIDVSELVKAYLKSLYQHNYQQTLVFILYVFLNEIKLARNLCVAINNWKLH